MRCTIVVAAVLSATGAVAQQATDAIAPEAASVAGSGLSSAFAGLSVPAQAALADKEARRPVKGKEWMVAAAHPAAVEAGAKILDAGGTAADAMVAVQTVLGLVEPQSSGIGGGAFVGGLVIASLGLAMVGYVGAGIALIAMVCLMVYLARTQK